MIIRLEVSMAGARWSIQPKQYVASSVKEREMLHEMGIDEASDYILDEATCARLLASGQASEVVFDDPEPEPDPKPKSNSKKSSSSKTKKDEE
ncbi:MAG: hypothetical protein HUJ26_18960 [Planctomycetaceae bacterium]|nr:hypothetical protein [Planctomycetaceae bacterium]